MSKAKKKGLFAFLLALLASAIVSGTLLLSPATVNAAAGAETAEDGTVTISGVSNGNELFSAIREEGTAGQPLVIRFAENTGMNFTVGEGGNLYDSATGKPLGAGNFIIYDEYTAASSITLYNARHPKYKVARRPGRRPYHHERRDKGHGKREPRHEQF